MVKPRASIPVTIRYGRYAAISGAELASRAAIECLRLRLAGDVRRCGPAHRSVAAADHFAHATPQAPTNLADVAPSTIDLLVIQLRLAGGKWLYGRVDIGMQIDRARREPIADRRPYALPVRLPELPARSRKRCHFLAAIAFRCRDWFPSGTPRSIRRRCLRSVLGRPSSPARRAGRLPFGPPQQPYAALAGLRGLPTITDSHTFWRPPPAREHSPEAIHYPSRTFTAGQSRSSHGQWELNLKAVALLLRHEVSDWGVQSLGNIKQPLEQQATTALLDGD